MMHFSLLAILLAYGTMGFFIQIQLLDLEEEMLLRFYQEADSRFLITKKQYSNNLLGARPTAGAFFVT